VVNVSGPFIEGKMNKSVLLAVEILLGQVSRILTRGECRRWCWIGCTIVIKYVTM